MNTISFNKAIQMVHPDTNPNIVDAGTKVREIMMYKKEPTMMYMLLKKWGLINNTTTSKSRGPRKRYNHALKNLFRNHDYSHENIFIFHRRYYGRFYVKRTTAKRVYFSDKTVRETGMKYCSMSSVNRAFRQGEWE